MYRQETELAAQYVIAPISTRFMNEDSYTNCKEQLSLAPKVQNDSATPRHIHAQPAIFINLHRLAPCDVV